MPEARLDGALGSPGWQEGSLPVALGTGWAIRSLPNHSVMVMLIHKVLPLHVPFHRQVLLIPILVRPTIYLH